MLKLGKNVTVIFMKYMYKHDCLQVMLEIINTAMNATMYKMHFKQIFMYMFM